MSTTIPSQHPAVVLRSHYTQLRALLAIAMIAVVGLTVAVVILAINDNGGTGATSEQPAQAPAVLAPASPTTRYDGGPEEGTRGPVIAPAPPTTRYDGGPEEGTRGPVIAPAPPTTRYDGGPEEGTSGSGH
jgi:hypothetical protein